MTRRSNKLRKPSPPKVLDPGSDNPPKSAASSPGGRAEAPASASKPAGSPSPSSSSPKQSAQPAAPAAPIRLEIEGRDERDARETAPRVEPPPERPRAREKFPSRETAPPAASTASAATSATAASSATAAPPADDDASEAETVIREAPALEAVRAAVADARARREASAGSVTEDDAAPPAPAGAKPAGGAPRPRRVRRRLTLGRKLLFLSIPYVLLFAALLGIEGYVRLTKPHIPSLQAFVEVVFEAIGTDNVQNEIYRGDPWLSWAFLPNHENSWWSWTTFSTNPQGIRYPEPLVGKWKRFRILCFGDSVTFGFRIPSTAQASRMTFDPTHRPYAFLMEDRLREVNSDDFVQVVPMGVPGYTTHQGLQWMRRDIGRYDPDVVTICYGFNDTQTRLQSDKETIPTGRFMIFQRWLMMRSQAMMHFVRWRENRARERAAAARAAEVERAEQAGLPPPLPTPPPAPVPRVSREDYVANCLAMAKVAREHGAKPVVLHPIYRDHLHEVDQALRIMDYARALEAACEAEGIPFLKIDELTVSDYWTNTVFFGENVHPNEYGHRLMATRILEFLYRRGMLGKLKID